MSFYVVGVARHAERSWDTHSNRAGLTSEVACCAVCGCAGGPCTAPEPTRTCPHAAGARSTGVRADAVAVELAGLGMASLFLLGGVLFAIG
jgi:hypothetical protein